MRRHQFQIVESIQQVVVLKSRYTFPSFIPCIELDDKSFLQQCILAPKVLYPDRSFDCLDDCGCLLVYEPQLYSIGTGCAFEVENHYEAFAPLHSMQAVQIL